MIKTQRDIRIRKIKRVVVLKKKRVYLMPFRFVSILLIIAFAGNLFFTNNNQSASAATYTFSQTNWSGGITANNAAHPTNQTSWDQFSASTTGMTTANSGADLQLLAIASSTIHTSDADFNLGSNVSTTIYGGRVKLNGTNPPASGGSNLGGQTFIGTSGQAYAPFIIKLSNEKYRIYYMYRTGGTGSTEQIAYKETTNTNPPASGGSNLGAQVTIGMGSPVSSGTQQPPSFFIIQLSSGKYRIYYNYNNGTYWQLAYKETTDTNPPASGGSNLGSQVTIGTGSSGSDMALSPFIIKLSNNKHRMYYTYFNGSFSQLAYKETTDTNLPASGGSNLGSRQLINTGSSAGDYAVSPFIIQLSKSKNMIYYTSPIENLAYKETTDTNLPASGGSNL
ncbi:MAG: hypothetical protein Q8Q21_02045, partial [bacterium]|nr:hypothetical protein [bacterium]